MTGIFTSKIKMQKTPYGLRTHIGILGRRNSGKSTLLNALTHQQISIVSEKAGTTTDPVLKAMELKPFGPVVFYDTAGLDDIGKLGKSRVQKTYSIIEKLDLAIIVAVADQWNDFDDHTVEHLKKYRIPLIVVFNKCDLSVPEPALLQRLKEQDIPAVLTIATTEQGIDDLRRLLANYAKKEINDPDTIIGDLINADDTVILVTPIDNEAPKGRLILPQVQIIRDLLDHDARCLVVKENGLKWALDQLKIPPKIVITDSQAFKQVDQDTPRDILLTSFSILFARFKGDLQAFVDGVLLIENLRPGDEILIVEACTHHPISDDIGTVKIPQWLNQRVGGELCYSHNHGADFPESIEGLKKYKLVIHCGSCNFTRKQLLNRIKKCGEADVPITNYGIVISYLLNIMQRALEPFHFPE
ncbi:MAG: [FeFe] hydrogenase H-cluster maturation GTPase HydF [Candidatus Electryonea clarkiae]|nr:[FeFe] hydrogenase H-cluster maturation GTPase HydF [Candidatus Electryonea clarkiae]MDP8285966.1 [FeFe] hydrogenase H-cluster maturation GTPase HydF [Candidatus Electryonea clarkiae]